MRGADIAAELEAPLARHDRPPGRALVLADGLWQASPRVRGPTPDERVRP